MKQVPLTDEEQWHALRRQHVGSSEIAALFDASPYLTQLTLWADKAGKAVADRRDNERMDWGKRLERAIAEGVSEQMRWKLEKPEVYCQHDAIAGLGCTLDYWCLDHEAGPGVVEVKNVDWLQWKTGWTETAAPAHIELQLQHQLAVTGFAWGAIAVLIGGNDLRIYERKPMPKPIAEIEARVAAFWQSIADAKTPDAFGTAAEVAVLAELYPLEEPPLIIEVADNKLAETAAQYAWAQLQERMGKKTREATKPKLMAAMQKAELMILPGQTVRQRRDSRGAVTLIVDKNEIPAADDAPTVNIFA